MSDEEKKQEETGEFAGPDSGEMPQERRGRKPKNSVIDPEVLAKTKGQARDAGQKTSPVQKAMMNPDLTRSGLEALLAKQRQLPPVTVEDADRMSHDPNEFPECVRRLIREKKYYFCWMKDPFGRIVSQSDMNQAHIVLRAWGGGGIYDIANRENLGEWIDEWEFSDDGVVRRLDQILLFTPWPVWERRKQREQDMDASRLEATAKGHDEEGQIPGARPVPSELGPDAFVLPGQHGMNAPVW